MILKSLAMASAGLALVAAPVAASAAPAANPASSLSVAKSVRAGTATTKSNKIGGASTIPLLIGAGIIAGVTYLIVDHENDDDNSDSN
ncbi:MAG: hypothetical protein EOP67_67385 [Sphingomonas sp.]|nr:MAG: hypothetical protein EOP67_67385 [Sphingomonas sp.]